MEKVTPDPVIEDEKEESVSKATVIIDGLSDDEESNRDIVEAEL